MMRRYLVFLTLYTLCIQFETVQPLNILGVFPYQGKSHFLLFETYLKELALRGHTVTVISYFPQEKTVNNYNDISLVGKAQILEDAFAFEKTTYRSIMDVLFFIVKTGTENCRTLLADENVQNLWKSKKKFDVVVVEQFGSDCSLGLAYKLGSPVVGLTSHVLIAWHYERFGVPYNPSFVPFVFLDGGIKPSLYQRVERIIFDTCFRIVYKYRSQKVDERTLADYFDDVPPLEELARNMKFMLSYTNFVLFHSNLLPANVIEVGGYHVEKPKPLPDNLRNFIENSEDGVIYISFGSLLKTSSLPKDKIDAIIGALSELPQRVIWKWKGDSLPNNTKNIFFSGWLPQNDILAHPKVVAFYSHCGLLGTTESLHHGIPMLGMPIFGDQPSNAAVIEESGLGVQILASDLTKERLLEKFNIILDPKFREHVKTMSKAFRDRPISPMDSAVYWTEYAARFSNFTFRSPAADVPLYQYFCLDVVCVMIVICFMLFFITKTFLFIVSRKIDQILSKKQKKS